MAATIPSIDNNLCGQWTEQDIDFYNKLPYYFAKGSTEFRKYWPTWPKMLSKIPWQPNMGTTMRRVMIEPTPVMRQQAVPNLITDRPTQDLINVRERTVDAKIRWKQFVSPHFNFLPSFQDFMRGNIKPTRENIDRQMMIYEEQFYRTFMWHWSPYVYIAGYGLVDAPQGDPDSASAPTTGKTLGWLSNQCLNVKESLTFKELFKAMNEFEDSVGATPFEGPGTPGGDNGPLSEKFGLVTSSTTWNEFLDDPWLKENRPLNMNIVTDSFKGSFFGKLTTKIEKYGFRVLMSNAGVASFPDPETVEMNPNSPQYGRTFPLPNYAKNSQYAISWLVGGPNYSYIESGPPASEFTSGGIPEGFGKMNWNGEIIMNKNFLVPCLDASGNQFMDTNSWGHYLRLQAECNYGIAGDNRFNVLPILHLRKTGILTTSLP